MKTYLLLILLPVTAAILASASCSNTCPPVEKQEQISDTLTYMTMLWSHYRTAGRQDSVIISATPLLELYFSRKDTTGVKYTGLSIAQAYILSGADYDTVRSFMSRMLPYFKDGPDSRTATMYWTVLGHYNLKYGLNYAMALSCYLKALDAARTRNKVNSQITMLYNIVNIFYICRDSHGMEYAMEALKLAEHDSVNTFNKTVAYLAAAQTFTIASESGKALEMLEKAKVLAENSNMEYFKPLISFVYGDINTMTGDYTAAGRYYRRALDYSDNAEPSVISMICLNYGRMYEKAGDPVNAIRQYTYGLRVSNAFHNLEFREDILKSLAALLYDTGDTYTASVYMRQYLHFIDSIALENKEHNLFNMLLSYENAQHRYELARRDLAISEQRQRLMITLLISMVLLTICLFLGIMYARQRRIYREAAVRYEEYQRRLFRNAKHDERLSSLNSPEHDTMSSLYLRLENLMQSGAYRQQDLSLEKIAAMLGSNRTYVSNTINKMAGLTFYSYLDSYRIKEAIRILSDPELSEAVSLKTLAGDIGYNSTQVFHRAFKKETGATPGIYKQESLKISHKTQNNSA